MVLDGFWPVVKLLLAGKLMATCWKSLSSKQVLYIGGRFCGWPHDESPTIWGPYSAPVLVRNSRMGSSKTARMPYDLTAQPLSGSGMSFLFLAFCSVLLHI